MEDGDGLVLAPTIKRIQPKAASLLLSSKTQWATLEAARDLGYHDVLQKSLIEAELMERLVLLLQGDGKKESNQNTAGSKIHLLSIREREILNDVATGATTEEIAQARHISVATIKSHLTSIYRKLDVRNRVEAVAVLRRG
jgi:DNA-binding NarL/FixJ family response regulator